MKKLTKIVLLIVFIFAVASPAWAGRYETCTGKCRHKFGEYGKKTSACTTGCSFAGNHASQKSKAEQQCQNNSWIKQKESCVEGVRLY